MTFELNRQSLIENRKSLIVKSSAPITRHSCIARDGA